ncbi:hypothetical protein OOK36_38840 [Streptomyces sp. NBC_00365]|uniref:hypothetical protein n=1 Tax=Streptomyces sp. NBC_00365 TaxID=2975726 RepID=UPI002256AB33|nr:hypothetical protein [Streptomyces sp. NBC_00365]MCX5094715.1 hypothetical protein [Streptomyces sp. NBC_00365]
MRRRFRRGDRAGIGPAGALGQQPGGTRPEKALRGPGGKVDDPADDVQPVPAERFRRGVADPGQRGDRPRIQPVGRLSEGRVVSPGADASAAIAAIMRLPASPALLSMPYSTFSRIFANCTTS